MNRDLYNAEGYYDPTAYEALRAVDREIRAKQKPRYPKVYICSPFRGDTQRNTANAIAYCRFAVKQGCFPIAPHIWLPRFLDDADPDERALGLSFGLRLLAGCREVWVFGGVISEGMAREIHEAKRRDLPIKTFPVNSEVSP